jgi:hypothetical protein
MPSAEPLGVATLPGYALRFHKRSKKDGSAKCDAFATLDEDAAVVGVLFKFDPAERGKLDAAEGAGKGYDARVVTVVNHDGRRRKVLSYFASPDAIDASLKPYTWYKDHVMAGAKEHNLPPNYIAQYIDAVEAVEDPDKERDKKERATIATTRADRRYADFQVGVTIRSVSKAALPKVA